MDETWAGEQIRAALDPGQAASKGRSLTPEEIAELYPATRPLPEGYTRPVKRPMGWAAAPVEPVVPSQRAAPGEYHRMSAAQKRAYAAGRKP